MAQDSYLSSSDRRLHFGLGAETAANLTIHWPNGLIDRVDNVPADHLVWIREGTGIVSRTRFQGLIELALGLNFNLADIPCSRVHKTRHKYLVSNCRNDTGLLEAELGFIERSFISDALRSWKAPIASGEIYSTPIGRCGNG